MRLRRSSSDSGDACGAADAMVNSSAGASGGKCYSV